MRFLAQWSMTCWRAFRLLLFGLPRGAHLAMASGVPGDSATARMSETPRMRASPGSGRGQVVHSRNSAESPCPRHFATASLSVQISSRLRSWVSVGAPPRVRISSGLQNTGAWSSSVMARGRARSMSTPTGQVLTAATQRSPARLQLVCRSGSEPNRGAPEGSRSTVCDRPGCGATVFARFTAASEGVLRSVECPQTVTNPCARHADKVSSRVDVANGRCHGICDELEPSSN